MSHYISPELRAKVIKRANFCCEYCRLPERIGRIPFEVDHIVAIKHGGKTIPENLAYTCVHCNRFKGSNLTTILDDEDTPVRIFNPRKHLWDEHFEITSGVIYSKTPIGEATIKLLNFNSVERIITRRILIEAGLYP